MPLTGIPEPEIMYKISHHQKNDSGELDVFEAARYFSGANEIFTYNNGRSFTQKVVGIDHYHQVKQASKTGRFSLDMPVRTSINASQNFVMEKPMMINDKKKYKQPSSPGGKLAHFLNSLFSQSSSRKKKSKSISATQSIKDEDHQSPGWRRKRRTSISHFQSTTVSADSKSVDSHSSSGFRTPPPYLITPTKSYKDPRSYSDYQQITSFSKQRGDQGKSVSLTNGIFADKKPNQLDCAWLDEKFSFVDENLQSYKNSNRGVAEKNLGNKWGDRLLYEEKEYEEMKNDSAADDDDAESDSSSDLFELPNYDLDCISSGLPVYETTNMDNIKRRIAPPITSAAR